MTKGRFQLSRREFIGLGAAGAATLALRGPLTFAVPLKRTDKCLIGGIDRNKVLVQGTPADVDAQVKDAWEQVGRRGLILGPGCVANVHSKKENVLQLGKSVEQTANL